MSSISIRLADSGDSKDIFAWRNDELTRQMSHTMDKIEWEEHAKWFVSSLSNPNRFLLLCYVAKGGEKIGVVRFDLESDAAVISINLAPLMRGNGLATLCLEAALTYLREKNPSIKRVKAEIKMLNTASRRSFERVGFALEREIDGVGYFECGAF